MLKMFVSAKRKRKSLNGRAPVKMISYLIPMTSRFHRKRSVLKLNRRYSILTMTI
ncbi:unnamed protein product, partial [Soboliphyme baturini]|uniref:Uncharacterized protein n=1 Tax=Soboliphyme baturini TaxID=241478 RepID=A0A183IXB6_9BILA